MKKIFDIATFLFPLFLEMNQKILGGRKGMIVVVSEINVPSNTFEVILGEIPEEKLEEKRAYAKEKIARLRERNAAGYSDTTSFNSDNPEEKQYGGAIRTKHFYFSGSGLLPKPEEEFLIILGLLAKELNDGITVAIMEESMKRRSVKC
jgi:hypothetical protein